LAILLNARSFLSYTTYVINDAEATYANAYFEINYVNIYSSSSSSAANTSGAAGTASATKTATIGVSGTAASGAASTTGKSAGVRRWEGAGMGWVGVVTLGVIGGVAVIM
jgi:hypothetical protein